MYTATEAKKKRKDLSAEPMKEVGSFSVKDIKSYKPMEAEMVKGILKGVSAKQEPPSSQEEKDAVSEIEGKVQYWKSKTKNPSYEEKLMKLKSKKK